MYNSIHSKFIKTPIINILVDGVNACHGICGIENYPLHEYILQSIFLKMTGAQEQKLKCICWEIATNDYEFRYSYLKNKDYGEISCYKQKNDIYDVLIKQIKKNDHNFTTDNFHLLLDGFEVSEHFFIEKETEIKVNDEIKKQSKNKQRLSEENIQQIRTNILNECERNKLKILNKYSPQIIRSKIESLLKESILCTDEYRIYSFWKSENDYFFWPESRKNGLLSDRLSLLYDEIVTRHRHRCAHNLTSYQQNLPSLNTLAKSNYKYDNYFFRFTLLILIDEIFISLYNEYTLKFNNL